MFSNDERIERINKFLQIDAYKELFPDNFSLSKDDIPLSKYYVISENKHVLVATTTPNATDIPVESKDLFFAASVLLSIVTAALAKDGKKLEDQESVAKIFNKNQSTAHIGSYENNFEYSNSEFSISTALLKTLIKGLSPGAGAIGIAEEILSIMGDSIKFALTNQQSSKKIAHVMFITEYLMGVPLVTISIFWLIASEASFVTTTNCHSTTSQTIKSRIKRDDFMFVDPAWIAKYGPGLVNTPEFDKIVDEFYKLLKV